MSSTAAVILGLLAALAAAIVAFVMLIPESKRPGLNKFFRWVHDFFNFKTLWLEKILKFLYVFQTLACIGIGFFMLFTFERDWWSGKLVWTGYWGFFLIILGPIVSRIVYEFIMLAILMVKNTGEINRKLKPQPGSPADIDAQERAEKAQAEAARKAEQEAARARYQQMQYAQQQMYAQQYQQQYPQPQYPQQPYPQQQPDQPEDSGQQQ